MPPGLGAALGEPPGGGGGGGGGGGLPHLLLPPPQKCRQLLRHQVVQEWQCCREEDQPQLQLKQPCQRLVLPLLWLCHRLHR